MDTDVLSFYLKNDSRFASYAQALDGKQLVISFQTQAELMLWQELHHWGEARRERVENLIAQQYLVFPVDEHLCRTWARLRSDVQKAGRVLHVADAWIAATAIALSVPLATHNVRDFSQVPGLQSIRRLAG
ncbi:PIN domain-containing protein [Rhodopirellula sp. P2]|uniref:PIN domain-containing protein n=1 Tax=Rhodopirellula sp. P2 TaxID=2127060 RepID=UPI002367A0A6|nr:PIN domain-containing protein [Rhodopirellula sp. P2]WDQ16490.1 PIN domain-containing protein [Rhodopirellula sp. P2]WDQ16504.1 PIN domain-containing protein [Rhodopirellula sp. P2]